MRNFIRKYSVLIFFGLDICVIMFQLYLIFTFHGPQTGDAERHVLLAAAAAENNELYPSARNLFDPYICATGYVNLLNLIFRFTSSGVFPMILNMIFLQIIFFSSMFIVKKGFPKSNYWVTGILFCLFGTFWPEVIQLRTELCYTALAFLSIALLYSESRSLIKYVLSGVLIALANWVRPLGLAFIPAAIWIMFLHKEKRGAYIRYFASIAAVLIIIGGTSWISNGNFWVQPVTSGANLIMGANDDADGSYNDSVFEEGNIGHLPPLENIHVSDRNSYYTKQAVGWILKHPLKYTYLFIPKLFYTYATETYTGSGYFQNEKNTSGLEYIKEAVAVFVGKGDRAPQAGDFLILYSQLSYMIVMLVFAVKSILLIKRGFLRNIMPLAIIVFLGTAMTVVTVGGARYHFPYLPIFLMITSLSLKDLDLTSKKKCNMI